jgi:hypothetical protein
MTITISQAKRNPKIPITTPHGTRKSPNLNSAVRRRVKKSIPGSLFHFFGIEASAADYPQVGIHEQTALEIAGYDVLAFSLWHGLKLKPRQGELRC